MVAVPREHLAEVYALLGRLMNPPTGRPPADSADDVGCPHCGGSAYLGAPGGAYRCVDCGLTFRQPAPAGQIEVDHENGCWSERMVQRLYDEVRGSNAARVLTLVAEAAPSTVGSEELAARLSADANTLRADLGALSKACTRLFGRKIWPMRARQGWGGGSRMGYRMPEPVAEWWLALARADAPSGSGGPARRLIGSR